MTTVATRARNVDAAALVEERRLDLVVVAAAAAWAGLFSWLSVLRHEAFWTGRFDLGNMTQAVWSTLQGRPLESTDVAGEQISRLAAHVDPLLLVTVPAYLVWPDPRALLVTQAVIVAAGALPAYWLARRWIGEPRLALAIPAAYLLYPPLQWATVTDMHPVTLAAPLLLLAIWAAEERRDVVLGIAVVLALLAKEQVGLTVAALGLWLWLARGRKGAGVALLTGGLAWTAIAVGIVQPLASSGSGSPFEGRYSSLGDGPRDVLVGLVTRPWEAVQLMIEHGALSYLAGLVVPLLLLPLLAPGLAAVAVPELGLNLLSDWPAQHTIQFHYVAVATPILIAAAARGLARVVNGDAPGPLARLRLRPAATAVALVVVSGLSGVVLGPLPWWRHVPLGSQDRTAQFAQGEHTEAMRAAVALVPEGVPVSASNPLAAHLSERRRIYTFPTIRDAQLVLVDRQRPFVHDLESRRRHDAALRRFEARPEFERIYQRDGVIVFRRDDG